MKIDIKFSLFWLLKKKIANYPYCMIVQLSNCSIESKKSKYSCCFKLNQIDLKNKKYILNRGGGVQKTHSCTP
jgi:hypothetical protein